MQTANAIKKLERNGFKISGTNKRFTATKENFRHYIEVITQDDRVIIIDLRLHGQEDDSMSDYHAGVFCDSVTQAIKLCND